MCEDDCVQLIRSTAHALTDRSAHKLPNMLL